jgi:16S rRNA G966 N2-methylase RsmD
MHIGTGQFEGKQLKDSNDGAPLSTRILTIKESIFEIMGIRIHESAVLDINDQNGMYGIEAISKGAAVVQFLNLHEEDKKLITENLRIVGLKPDDFIIEGDTRNFLETISSVRFDVIFFRAVDSHCLELLPKVLQLQNPNGITAVFYPNSNECSLDFAPEGYEMIDCREVETQKVMVMVKKK